MFLNMYILNDWISRQFDTQAHIEDGIALIEGVRFFAGELPEILKNYVYVGNGSEVFDSARYQNTIMLCNTYDIILVSGQSLETVINEVLRCMDYFNAWEARLHNSISSDQSLNHIINACADVLHASVGMIDMQGNLIELSTALNQDISSDVWEQIRRTRRLSSDVMSSPVSLRTGSPVADYTAEPALYAMSDGKNSIICYIRIDREYVAVMSVKELEKPLTRGDCLIVRHVRDAIQQAVLLEEKNHRRQSLLSTTVAMQQLLAGEPKENTLDVLDFAVQKRDIQRPWLLAATRDLNNQTAVARQWYSHELQNIPVPNISVPWKNEVVILLSERDRSRFLDGLNAFFRKSGSIGISLPLYQLYEIPVKYKQAVFALEQCGGRAEVRDARDLIFPYLLYQLRGLNHDLGFTHPAIEKLKNYDQEKGSELCKTLITYLENERNLTETARLLFIHRNTLSNRIEKIQEIADINLDDPTERLYILLSNFI